MEWRKDRSPKTDGQQIHKTLVDHYEGEFKTQTIQNAYAVITVCNIPIKHGTPYPVNYSVKFSLPKDLRIRKILVRIDEMINKSLVITNMEQQMVTTT